MTRDPAVLEPVNCLLVDDLRDNLLALSAVLKSPQVNMLTASSGPQALELLLTHEVALALVDVQMPEMDGFELAELMRGSTRTRDIPIIFVTAGAHDRGRLFRGYDSGAVDFLHKPVEAHVLKNKANVFFQLYRQKRQLARELAERTQTLHLNEMFVAMLSHDLRNPLSAMLTSAGALKHASAEPAVQTAATRLLASGHRMAGMIDDLLDLARVRLGRGLMLDRSRTSLERVLQRVVQEHQSVHPDRCMVLDVIGDTVGEWDANRLAQVASNLVGNAIQHGVPDVPVRIRADGRSPDAVTLSVFNGGRIPDDRMARLFDPFTGTETARSARDGLGLGLYIVQQIVERHGGRVTASLDGEHGTRFDVLLPRC